MSRARRHRDRSLAPVLSVLLTLAFVLVAPPAHAGNKLKRLEGDIIVSKKRFPSRFDSDAEMYSHMRKVNTHELKADDDGWEFQYMAFLPGPVTSLQAAVTFYDVTVPGTQKLVDTRIFYPANRKDKVINGSAHLKKEMFSADRKYLMVFSRGYGQRALATTKLVLRN